MRRLLVRCSLVLPVVATMASAQSDEPSLAEVLHVAGAYVAGFERPEALLAEEEYFQQVTHGRRTLRSDILFIKDKAFGWVEFRDVIARDGIPVRDRQERLLALFTNPNPDRLKQAQRIVAEGARFNLDPPGARLDRTINLPLTAMRFLRAPTQYRSTFRMARWNRQTGIASVEFTEQLRPRLISTADQTAATGRFEIDRITGRVTSSNLVVQSGTTQARITVRFAPDAGIDLWLPSTMDEEYRGPFNGFVTGTAKYSKYRQFRVETSEIMKH